MNKKLFAQIFISLSVFCFGCFADVVVVSPPVFTDTFGNKQTLMINAMQGEEVFYSITDADPLTSGFAYDGPVSLDLTGDVKIKVTSVLNNKKQSFIISYHVDDKKQGVFSTLDEQRFIEMLSAVPVYELKSGEILSIPETFEYCISPINQKPVFEKGRNIYISHESNLDRYFSLVIKKGTFIWNFIIHSLPEQSEEAPGETLPFVFDNWSKLKFTDNKFIYQVDDGLWTSYKNNVELDRSVEHIIRWQSVDYDSLNPVMTYRVPVAPVMNCVTKENYSMVISLDGDQSYRFSKNPHFPNINVAEGYHKAVVVDAFQGERLSSLLALDVYSNEVYQGTLYAPVEVNRQKPLSPELICSNDSYIKREDVTISFESEADKLINYYIIQKKVTDVSSLTKSAVNEMFEKEISYGNSPEYETYDGSEIILSADDQSACVFAVCYYASDSYGNFSDVNTYYAVIDKCNYFISENASEIGADGTKERPFKDFSDVESIVNSRKFTRFYIEGKVKFPDANIVFTRNLEFTGDQYSQIEFSEFSNIILSSANLTINNVMVNSIFNESDKVKSIFTGSNSTLTLNNCEISFARNRSASMIDLEKSTVNVNNCGLSSMANEYSNVISLNNSKLSIDNSRLITVANTTVNISCKKTSVNLVNSKCRVSGSIGRIAELYSSTGQIIGNDFEAENLLLKSDSNDPVWKDKKSSVVYKNSSNRVSGFFE